MEIELTLLFPRLNLFRYVANGETNGIDPSGLKDEPAGDVTVVKQNYPSKPGWVNLLKTDVDIHNQMYKDWYKGTAKDRKERGMWILWYPRTGQVGMTRKGITQRPDDGNLNVSLPNMPGWEVIGHYHTHKPGGSAQPSFSVEGDDSQSDIRTA